jgi:hypothetical protein
MHQFITSGLTSSFKLLMLFHRQKVREGHFKFASYLLWKMQEARHNPYKPLSFYIGDTDDMFYESGFVKSFEPGTGPQGGGYFGTPRHNGMKQINWRNGITLVFPEGRYIKGRAPRKHI